MPSLQPNGAAQGAIRRATLATMMGDGYGLIPEGTLVWEAGRLLFAGPDRALPPGLLRDDARVVDAGGALVTPGLLDCHTHLVFAGDRSVEFEQRLNGVDYQTIARNGGGIWSTVTHTRAASFEALLEPSLARARALVADGVTTVEIKSGYALEPAGERRMLEAADAIGRRLGITVCKTYLGAHALPPEFKERRADYIGEVCATITELAQERRIDAVDGYHESIAFSTEEIRQVLETAIRAGLPIKLHADQLSNGGGAALAATYRGLSADHVEHTDAAGIAALRASGTVAVLLPGAFYNLRETRLPPINGFRDAGVPMAVATDLNPGTSPLCSLRLAMHMACTLFGLTPVEALRGVTVNAARALGRFPSKGILQAGADADCVLWHAQHPAQLIYWMGGQRAHRVCAAGKWIFPEAN